MGGCFVGCNKCYGAAGTLADRVVGDGDAISRSGGRRARGLAEWPGGDRTTQSRSSARRTTQRVGRDIEAPVRVGRRSEAYQGANGPAHARRRCGAGAWAAPLPLTDNLLCLVVRGITCIRLRDRV